MVIIAAIDRSERAGAVLTEAETLADAFSDEIHAIHVISAGEFREIQEDSYEETGRTIEMDKIRAFAQEVAEDTIDEESVAATPVGVIGNAAKEILSYADEHDARYIVVGPRKRSPAGKALFGSVAQSLLLGAECPVVAVSEAQIE